MGMYVCKEPSSCTLKMAALYDQLYLNLKPIKILRRKKKKSQTLSQVWEALALAY